MSVDSDGISTKMIKFVGPEISHPLSHVFNLSLVSGVFPEKLKMCRVICGYLYIIIHTENSYMYLS